MNDTIFEKQILFMFDELTTEFSLSPASFSLKKNYSKAGANPGSLISTEIDIHEEVYPPDNAHSIASTSLVLYLKPNPHYYELLVRHDRLSYISIPRTASLKPMADKLYTHILFQFEDSSIWTFIRENIVYCINNYLPSSSFGCCSRYKEYSSMKKCMHPNILYANGCQYRSNLESGNIFYNDLKDDSAMYDFICIDFEIANNNMNSACSLGIACVRNLRVVCKEYFLIKPPTGHFRPECSSIHGLTYEDVKDADTFDVIWDKIAHYFTDCHYVFAHNAYFDMSVLNECMNTYHIPKPSFTYIDSMNFSSKVCHDCGSSLAARCNYFNIPIEDHHNALSDAVMCAELVINSVLASKYKTFETYLKTYRSIHRHNFLDIHSQTYFRRGKKFENIRISELSTTNTSFDASNPFYQKSCVFTGELQSLGRKDAMQKVLDLGGIVKSAVGKKTDYLIVGVQNSSLVSEGGHSVKEKTAIALNESGYDIKILNEDTFLAMLQD